MDFFNKKVNKKTSADGAALLGKSAQNLALTALIITTFTS
jgi:hypothetical protein